MNRVITQDDKNFISVNIKKLGKEDHMKIYEILKRLPGTLYHITDYNIHFDLNKIPIVEFFMIYDHIKLSIDCINRNRIIDQSKQEQQQQELFNN